MKLLYFDEKHFSQLSYKFKSLKTKVTSSCGVFFLYRSEHKIEFWLGMTQKQGFIKAILLHTHSALVLTAN